MDGAVGGKSKEGAGQDSGMYVVSAMWNVFVRR